MDHSFSVTIEYNGRRYTAVRPGRRPRDPSDGEVRNYLGQLVSYEYILPNTKRARVAASTEDIQRLLREVRADDTSQTECAVCLQDFDAEETVRAMPVCAHAFHLHCISEWLGRNAVCPICRRCPRTRTRRSRRRTRWTSMASGEAGIGGEFQLVLNLGTSGISSHQFGQSLAV